MYNNFYIHKKKIAKDRSLLHDIGFSQTILFKCFFYQTLILKKKRNMMKRQSYGEMETEK